MNLHSKNWEREESKEQGLENRLLVLYNDDINTFDYVIETLCTVCDHDLIQAEQCAMITHHKGKCEIKKGSISDLLYFKNELAVKDLTVTIE